MVSKLFGTAAAILVHNLECLTRSILTEGEKRLGGGLREGHGIRFFYKAQRVYPILVFYSHKEPLNLSFSIRLVCF
jgi:hypothetical protein